MNDAVITMQAVVEMPAFDSESMPPWPVTPMPSGSWLVLNADNSDEQVRLFVAALAARIDVAPPGGRDEVMGALLAEEFLIVAGGLQVGDTGTGTVVVPGCCAGLEDWRDWAQVLTGGSPWLGHDPDPEVEVVGEDLRVWQDGGPDRHRGPWAGCRVGLPSRALPELLAGVQRDLVGFLDVLAGWARRAGLGRREELRWWGRSTRTSPSRRHACRLANRWRVDSGVGPGWPRRSSRLRRQGCPRAW